MKTTLFAALMLLSAQASFAQNEIIVGDMNDDNQLNIEDVSTLVSTVLGKTKVRKVAVSGSSSGGSSSDDYDNSGLVGTWYSYQADGAKLKMTFKEDGSYMNLKYQYQPSVKRLLLSNKSGKITCYRPVLELTPSTFTFYFPQNDSIAYYYRDFNSNMSAPEMTSSEGWTQTGDWSAIENGSTEAYGGWNANTNNDYNTHQTVTLAKGTYKLTGYAFYRSGETFNEDAETSLAYMYAGNKSVMVMTLGSIERSFYPNTIATANEAFYTDGDYKNVLYFTVDEDNTEVEIGYKGTHDASKAKSWFICGALNLEYLHDHEYVDLGLPSGTLWATMNVGANSPEEYGKYYAWGEITAYGEAPYLSEDEQSEIADGDLIINSEYMNQDTIRYSDWKYYKWGTNYDKILWYTGSQIELRSEDDAATANWGSNWRMPTSVELQELFDNCYSQKTTYNGLGGYTFTSKTDSSKSLFLPFAGIPNDGMHDLNWAGTYWSKTRNSQKELDAYAIYIHQTKAEVVTEHPRCLLTSIRPVYKKKAVRK